MSNKQPLCVIGNRHNIYTKMVLGHLHEQRLPFVFVDLAQTEGKTGLLQRVWNVINGNPYRQLSWLDPLRWKKLLRKIWFRRSARYKEQTQKFRHPISKLIDGKEWIQVGGLQTEAAQRFFKDNTFEVGLLAGVDEIVPGSILSQITGICLNAHPAPLPECRGGGALEQTLAQHLQPAVSVHQVTEELDAGDVLAREEVSVDPEDHFDALRLKLDIKRSKLLVTTAQRFLNGDSLERKPNTGSLHFWKDCTRKVQAEAERYLIQLRKDQ